MVEFTVLGNAVIQELLLGLSTDDITYFLKELENTLIAYSYGEERQYQPDAGIINRPGGQKILFRPFASSSTVGTKIIVHPAPISEASEASSGTEQKASASMQTNQSPLHGTMVLCDKYGHPTGFLNAEEVTGYRTTLSAMIPYVHRRRTDKIIVFGAGKQALWHSRLALALRGAEITSITIVNRSEVRAQELIETMKEENAIRWSSPCQFRFLNSSQDDAQEKLRSCLAEADVIFCTVASQQPLFTLEALGLKKRQGIYPLITAVGSWQPDMIEVHPAILRHITSSNGLNANGATTGAILVDDAEAALRHSGEIVQSGLTKTQMLEIGHILCWERNSELTRDQNMWLGTGLVVYKSIGVSMTDLAAGNSILALAEKKNLGTRVCGF